MKSRALHDLSTPPEIILVSSLAKSPSLPKKTNSLEHSTISNSHTSNSISHQLLPFIKFLRLIGRCPCSLTIITDSNRNFVSVSYQPGRMTTTAVWGSLIICVFFLGIFQSGCLGWQLFGPSEYWPDLVQPRKAYRETFRTYSRLILTSFEFLYTFMAILEYFIAWKSSAAFLRWLNIWNEIEEEFYPSISSIIPKISHNFSKFVRNFSLMYIGLPSLTFGVALNSVQWNYTGVHFPLWLITSSLYNFGSTACLHAEDAKSILVFKSIQTAFQYVRSDMEDFYQNLEDKSHPEKKVVVNSASRIRLWHRSLVKVRGQCKLAGDFMTVYQLLSITLLIYFLSTALFIAVDSFRNHSHCLKLSVVTVFCIITMCRLIGKIYFAVQVVHEENQILTVAKEIETSEGISGEAHNEICRLVDMVVQSPTQISLSGFVSMDNSLLLSIVGQVLTQLIVFMQLEDS